MCVHMSANTLKAMENLKAARQRVERLEEDIEHYEARIAEATNAYNRAKDDLDFHLGNLTNAHADHIVAVADMREAAGAFEEAKDEDTGTAALI